MRRIAQSLSCVASLLIPIELGAAQLLHPSSRSKLRLQICECRFDSDRCLYIGQRLTALTPPLQARGIHKLGDDHRCCAEVMTRFATIREALRIGRSGADAQPPGHRAFTAIRKRDGDDEETYDELVEVIDRQSPQAADRCTGH